MTVRMKPTRSAFLAIYKQNLFASQKWTGDARKLGPFMANVKLTIEGQDTGWSPDTIEAMAAWYDIGGEGEPTLDKLRDLTD